MARARSGVWVVLGGVLGALTVVWFLWFRVEPVPAAGTWLPGAAEESAASDGAGEMPPPASDAPRPGRRDLMTAPPMPRFPERLEAAWVRALALHEDFESAEALRLLLPFVEDYPDFFRQATHAPVLIEIRAAVAEALKEQAPKRVLREMVKAVLRGEAPPTFVGDSERAKLFRKLAATAQVVAAVPKPEQREQMLRHAERFLIPAEVRAGTARGARAKTGDSTPTTGADALLQQLRTRLKERAKPVAPLPVARPEEVESRRLAQLENLHKRDVVALLDTIHTGLLWLVLYQGEDGRFSDAAAAEHVGRFEAKARDEKKAKKKALRELRWGDHFAVPSTALGIIALLDFRDQDVTGLFEPALALAVQWLLKQQAKDGSFRGERPFYTQAIALMALGQVTASSGSEPVRLAVERGLEQLHKGAGPNGGYRYGHGQAGDISVSGWVAQALEMARRAKAEIPEGMEDGLTEFLRLVWVDGHEFRYVVGRRRATRSTLFPVGMLMGHILLEEVQEDVTTGWRAHLHKPGYTKRPTLYTLYYGVRMSILLDEKLADPWRTWTQEVAEAQLAEGLLAGTFPGTLSPIMRNAGIALNTTMALLTLEHALYLR